MSKTATALLAIAVAAIAVTAASLAGLVTLNIGGDAKPARYGNRGILEAICEVQASRPGDKLAIPFETSKLTLPVVFNFDEQTGAYPGEYAISMNRKGTLRVNGSELEIHRPAMFKRHSTVIIGEHVTLNRETGEFRQWLDLNGGKRLDLIQGTCKRTDNAPF